MRKGGAVADRRNRRIGGEQELVDHDSVVAFEAALPRQRVLRDDADADHDQVRAQRLAVGEDDRLRVLAPLDRGDAKPKPEARAERGVLFQEKIRHDRRHRPAHRARDLDHCRLGPEARGGRGDFEPDESGADDDNLGLGAKPLADRGRIGDVAEREHAGQIDAGHIEPPLPRASREDEMSVSESRFRR